MISGPIHHGSPEHHHAHKPIEPGYRLIVRTILWLIAGAVFIGFAIWWIMT